MAACAYHRVHGATLIVSGGFELETMRTEIERLFGSLPGDPVEPPPAVAAVERVDGPQWVEIEDVAASQTTIQVGFGGVPDPADGEARATLAILVRMVNDRLSLVRQRDGAAYHLSAGVSGGQAGRAIVMGGRVDPGRAGRALKTILDEMTALHTGADLAEDFVRARRRVLAHSIAAYAGASAVAADLEAAVIAGEPLDRQQHRAEAIASTTLDDVAALAAGVLAPEQRVVVVSGSPDVTVAMLDAVGASDVTHLTAPDKPW